jgi:hypothetical protein
MVAVFVSIYEARILKEQQIIMQNQEKTSVWPYIDGQLSYRYAQQLEISFDFENKGIGPAKVRKMDLIFNGAVVSDYTVLLDSLDNYFPEEANMGASFQPATGDVLSPGEEVTSLLIQSDRFPGDVQRIRNIALQFDLCYCSVYDECWAIDQNDHSLRIPCEQ